MQETITHKIDPNSVTERLRWRAVYDNGKHLEQKEPGADSPKYGDIDRTKLLYFDLLLGDTLIYRLRIKSPRQMLIYRRRVELPVGKPYRHLQVLVGYQYQEHGKNHQSVTMVWPDGHIETSSYWGEDKDWHAPTLHPHEGETFNSENRGKADNDG